MYVQNRQTNGWYLASVPVHWGDTNLNRLNSTLGAQMMRGLTGGVEDTYSDNLWCLNNQTWSRYWLSSTNVWKDTNNVPATAEIKPGAGFWIKRGTNGPASSKTVYAGRSHTNSTPIAFASNAWTILSWPYAAPRFDSDGLTTNKGWGFAAAGGVGSYTWRYGDDLTGEYGGNWFSIYLGTNGCWYVRGTRTPANVALEPGRAYYYFHRGTGMVWRATAAP